MPKKIIVFLALIFLGISTYAFVARADELDDTTTQLEKKQRSYQSTSQKLSNIRTQKDSVYKQLASLSSNLNTTQADIAKLENEINELEKQLDVINKNLTDRKGSLAEKIALRNLVVRNYSKKGVLNDLEMFFTTVDSVNLSGFGYSTLAYAFEKNYTIETIKLIEGLNSEIDSFEKDKAEAEALKTDLDNSQENLLALKNKLEREKNSAQGQFSDLQKKETSYIADLAKLQDDINNLTAKQQELLDAKSGAGSSSVGDYEAAQASLPSPGFSPAFAALSYGAYTHYNGMSQYGAKGRADDGQDYEKILKFYYKVGLTDMPNKDKDQKIKVKYDNGSTEEMSFQKYLWGLAEMPSDWPEDALKAQAVAGRTYAYGYAKQGKAICTTESCQAFLKSKSNNPPTKWKSAVDSTTGKILKDATTSQYSSTTGGYINNVGWDSKGSWPGGAYEKRANSPWFFKAWYTKSYSPSSDKCGRSSPWLKESEMADILNALVVWENGSKDDRNRISPITTNCWGGNPFSIDGMASKADDYGTKYSKVSDVFVDITDNGKTTKVKFSTDQGSLTVDGDKFKTVFNLRAPGYISLKSRLFDIKRE